jgi:hypothetical protein
MEREIIHIPIHYFTYNAPDVNTCVSVCILIFSFYVVLFLMFQFELYNKKNYCEPKFYYGRACRNQIADRILSNPELINAKRQFYSTMQKVGEVTDNVQTDIDRVSKGVHDGLESNEEFQRDTLDQINDVTRIVKMAAANYLGNLQGVVQSTKETSTAAWNQLQSIPALLKDLQTQINSAIVTPALAPYVGPLQKLYQSLSQMSPIQGHIQSQTPSPQVATRRQ